MEFLSKSGKKITFRVPTQNDAETMHSYINELSKEKTFIRFQGEEVSFKEEVDYLTHLLDQMDQKKAFHLLAFHQEKLIGISGIDRLDKTESHVGLFGISLRKEYRADGIGKKLMEYVILEAKRNIHLLEIIILQIFSDNIIAYEMYKKQGFTEYGRLPNGVKRQGQNFDLIFMYLQARN